MFLKEVPYSLPKAAIICVYFLFQIMVQTNMAGQVQGKVYSFGLNRCVQPSAGS